MCIIILIVDTWRSCPTGSVLAQGHVSDPEMEPGISERGIRLLTFLSVILQVYSSTQMEPEMILGSARQGRQMAPNLVMKSVYCFQLYLNGFKEKA